MAETNNSGPAKPVILIIPGSFSHASHYYVLADKLRALGYQTFVNNLPSTSRDEPEQPATLEDDAVFFRGIIEKLADRGDDVVVLMHSYGGAVGSEAVKGVGKDERQKAGRTGGVVKLVYLTAIVLEVGSSLRSESGDPPAALVEISESGFMRIVGVELVAQATFSDVEFTKAVDMVKTMPKHSARSFAGQLTYPGYKHLPTSYIFCENDSLIAADVQRKYIERIKAATGKGVDVHNLSTGHGPNLSAPDKLAEVVVGIITRASSA